MQTCFTEAKTQSKLSFTWDSNPALLCKSPKLSPSHCHIFPAHFISFTTFNYLLFAGGSHPKLVSNAQKRALEKCRSLLLSNSMNYSMMKGYYGFFLSSDTKICLCQLYASLLRLQQIILLMHSF